MIVILPEWGRSPDFLAGNVPSLLFVQVDLRTHLATAKPVAAAFCADGSSFLSGQMVLLLRI